VASAYGTVNADAKEGTIEFKTVTNGAETEGVFLYKGNATVVKSPLIPFKNITYIKATKKEDLRTPFKSQKITLNTEVNGGKLVAGQDYVLRIVLNHWIGMSEYDTYVKDAVVHATAKMTAEQFYKAMVESLNMAFSREVGATKKNNPYLDFKADAAGITITEKEQPWKLGLEQSEPVLFNAQPTTIYIKEDNDDEIWGTVTSNTAKKSEVVVGTTGKGNGHDIADLEYFCMGERGDQYRMVGWPNVIPTHYYIDATKEYNTLDLHFAYTDEGTASYRSEKDITIVAEDAEVINSIVKNFNSATGLKIKDLATAAEAPAAGGEGSGAGTGAGK
jgi:uncharacterized short protein YbdD (DUF466 family)